MYKKNILTQNEVEKQLAHYLSTQKNVRTVKSRWKLYCKFHNMTLHELINEALSEQEERVPLNQLKLYDRLMEYREYLLKEKSYSTVKTYIQTVQIIYKWFRVDVPRLPNLNIKQAILPEHIEFEEIISHDQVKEALEYVSLGVKARCMTMLTGGYNFDETARMTIRKFIDDNHRHHQCEDDEEALLYLSNQDNCIWANKTVRGKTKKPYFGFTNPETTQLIAKFLLSSDYQERESLFKYTYLTFNYHLQKVNDLLKFPQVGGMKLFRTHMFRKFNATNLTQGEGRLTPAEVDELQGRSKNSVQSTYMKTSRFDLELLYCKGMNKVSIYNTYDYHIKDGKIIVECTTNQKEKVLQSKVDKLTNPSDGLKNLIEEIGSDAFMRQVNNLANL